MQLYVYLSALGTNLPCLYEVFYINCWPVSRQGPVYISYLNFYRKSQLFLQLTSSNILFYPSLYIIVSYFVLNS